ncbi:hypothetical protein QWY31_09845 [Cytophagales bacterium LB-30]|uniref:Uncharacterized protein n=1 Tax=Shiella aurantiaca TaxID=3058365 RepID=A0ABT8F6F1_9BACT|nr:DUF6134 family protein [Shiella aurantiaca]MDN4165806.1 hypothetical protein [Shiella aurantiaca]
MARAALLVFLIFSIGELQAQSLQHYRMEVAGIQIGTLEARQVIHGNTMELFLNSEVSIRLVGQIQIALKTHEVYKDGILQQATVISTHNDTEYLSETLLVDGVYRINCQSRDYSYRASHLHPIRMTTTLLYFDEPSAGEMVYTPHYGLFTAVEKRGENSYSIRTVSNKQKLDYRQGVLQEVELVNRIKNVIIRKI